MKKYTIIIALTLGVMFNAFSQIQEVEREKFELVSEVKAGWLTVAKLSKSSDNNYLLTYADKQYVYTTSYKSLLFNANDEELNQLYNILANLFDNPEEKQFKLGNEEIAVKVNKNMGVKCLYIFDLNNNSYFYLTKKQLSKVFSKD
jgi:helix-turn-helix protein